MPIMRVNELEGMLAWVEEADVKPTKSLVSPTIFDMAELKLIFSTIYLS